MKNTLPNKIFKHLTNEDRIRIEVLLNEGNTQSNIAEKLKVNRSTVSREIKNRGTPSGYHAKIAQIDYQHKRQKCHPKNKIEETSIGSFIIAKIRAGWSPETISGRLKREIEQGLISDQLDLPLYCLSSPTPIGDPELVQVLDSRFRGNDSVKDSNQVNLI